MSAWNHAICAPCWFSQHPDVQRRDIPETGTLEQCCFCFDWTRHGIYVRKDPAEMRCKGGTRVHTRGTADEMLAVLEAIMEWEKGRPDTMPSPLWGRAQDVITKAKGK